MDGESFVFTWYIDVDRLYQDIVLERQARARMRELVSRHIQNIATTFNIDMYAPAPHNGRFKMVKIVRQLTGWGLYESKQLVDEIWPPVCDQCGTKRGEVRVR